MAFDCFFISVGGKIGLNGLALKAIEMTLSKEAADWWKQYSFKHWPINKATVRAL